MRKEMWEEGGGRRTYFVPPLFPHRRRNMKGWFRDKWAEN